MPTRRKRAAKRRPKPARRAPRAGGQLTARLLAAMQADFAAQPAYTMIQNAVTKVTVKDLAVRRDVVAEADHSFSIRLDDWAATNQKRSGRCWLFAGLNLLRAGAAKKMKLKNFEFSQNFVMFWDKLEKANYFLEAILQTADRGHDDRTVAFLLGQPISDGGQWNMFADIVGKYGLVPKAAMPETESSSNSGAMNSLLEAKLRQGARTLRDLHAGGAAAGRLRSAKEQILTAVHRILSIHLGRPPENFIWQWYDKKKKFHRDAKMTPRRFAAKYVTIPLDDYVCLVHDPRPSSPTGRLFTVQYLGNVVGAGVVRYLNVPIDRIKQIATRTLRAGEPVWFGCDVGKQMDRALGLWDANLRDYERLYDTTFELDKAARLEYAHARMTHAMLFTGVDIVNRRPRRWRVENSWGDKDGKKGFFIMNDSWFDEHLFEIAARARYLPVRLREALARRPIVLPPWDPMGALAGRR